MSVKQHKACLGLNGFGWAHVVTGMPYDFNKLLQHAKDLGFDGVELFGMPTPFPESAQDREALRKTVEDHGLRIASIQSLPGGLGNGHPGSSYTMCRRDYVTYIRSVLDLAAALGSDSVGVWAGEIFGTGPNPVCLNYLVDTYRQCAQVAADAGIPLCLEAEPVQLVNSPEAWFAILEGANSPYLRAICDFGHLNILSKQQPMDLLKRLMPYVGHTHLCDNDGTQAATESRSSTHLALGDGSMDWRGLLAALLDSGYDEWLDVDVWEHPDPFRASVKSKQALDAFLQGR